MHLLKSQLNELYGLIENQGYFSPVQFTISRGQTELIFKNTDFYFRIFEDTEYVNSLIANFSPGETLYRDSSSRTSWENIKICFRGWLDYLKREVLAPDKWELLNEEVRYLVGDVPVENIAFSHQEYLEVRRQIETVKNQLSLIPLLQEQNNAIIHQLSHLTEMTDKLNKFDWRNLFIGTIISCIVQLGITKEHAAMLFDVIKNTFNDWQLLK